MNGHVKPVVASGKAAWVGSLSAAKNLNVSIALPLRNQAVLTSLLRQVNDPSSPGYRQFLSVEQFTDQFGPTADDYQAVVDFAHAHGFAVTGTHANRMIVPLSGTVAQIEKAFNVKMNLYQHPTENRAFFSPDREPSIALSVPVTHISGLNNFSIPRPAVVLPQPGKATPGITGSGPGGTSYLPKDMRAAYYTTTSGETGLTGSGQVVGLLELDGYNISDVVLGSDGTVTSSANGSNYVLAYTPTVGGTTYRIPVDNVLLDGATGAACQLIPSSCADVEQAIDILQPMGMAPGLSQVRVYIGSSDVDIFSAMASENLAKQISVSWAWVPDDPASDDFIFQELAAQGQSLFVASGDSYAYEPNGFEFASPYFYPAEDAWVTAVGGTDLTTGSAGGAWSSETAWDQSGGGISPDSIALPSWQAGAADTANGGSTTLRNLPDVAAEANLDNYACDLGECQAGYGGTSFAAPRWAGFAALVNQQRTAAGEPTLGFLNPSLYPIGKGSNYDSAFHDITSGSNSCPNGPCFTTGAPPSFNAVSGYDLVTGWGTPNGQGLVNTLAPAVTEGFQLSASPSSLTLIPSGTGTTTITAKDVAGFAGSVNLSVSGLPSGVTASFGTNPTSATSVLTLTVSSSAIRGSALLTITGVSGSLTATTSLALEVNAPGFSLGLTGISTWQGGASTLFLYPGISGVYSIGVTDYAGFTGDVALAVTSGLPSGVGATWISNPTTGTSDLVVTPTTTTAAGTYSLIVTGISGTLSAFTALPLVVTRPVFSLSVSPTPSFIVQGTSITSTVTIDPVGDFTGPVTLSNSALGTPTGVTATFRPNPTTSSSVVTLTASSSATLGTAANFEILGTASGGLTEGGDAFPLTVVAASSPTFNLLPSSGNLVVTPGSSVTDAVTVSDLYGFSGDVTLSCLSLGGSALPSWLTASFSSNPTTGGSVLTLTTTSAAVLGWYQLELDGFSGTQAQSIQFELTVNPPPLFALGASSSSLTLAQGSSVNDTITLTPQSGFTGSATLTAVGLPAGAIAAFATNPVTSTSVLTLTGSSSVPAGSYLVIVGGTSGGRSVTIPIILTVTSAAPPSLVSDLVVDDTANAANWSIQSNLAVGDTQYGDRTFTLTTVPGTVAGSAWIRTANSSKAFTGATVATFTVTGNADVYVAFNDLITPRPSWLTAYTDSGISLVNSEATPKTFELFKKSFATGSTVTLSDGGNTTDSFYTVVVAPTPSAPPSLISNLVVEDTANAANWSIQSDLAVGATQYGDRTLTLTTVPSTVAGSAWIRTANSSKAFTGATIATFTLTGSADVYVAFNELITPKPSWLSAFADTGLNLVNSEAPPKTFTLLKESFATGSTVTLGNGGNTTDSFYTVVVAPAP